MIRELNAGDDVYAVNPQGQATDASSFIKLFQRLFGAGQGLSYEATSRDMSQSNYSSTRQGLIEDGMTYVEDEELLLEVMDEIYETFVISVVLAGLIKAPAFGATNRSSSSTNGSRTRSRGLTRPRKRPPQRSPFRQGKRPSSRLPQKTALTGKLRWTTSQKSFSTPKKNTVSI